MTRFRWRGTFAAAIAILLTLHVVDPWDGQGPTIGGLPWDLAYPLLWIAAAAVAVQVMTSRVWPDDPG